MSNYIYYISRCGHPSAPTYWGGEKFVSRLKDAVFFDNFADAYSEKSRIPIELVKPGYLDLTCRNATSFIADKRINWTDSSIAIQFIGVFEMKNFGM